jgi:hypothetical protein
MKDLFLKLALYEISEYHFKKTWRKILSHFSGINEETFAELHMTIVKNSPQIYTHSGWQIEELRCLGNKTHDIKQYLQWRVMWIVHV